MNDFGKKLRILRNEKGITQRKLTKALNRGQSAISDYETGGIEPSIGDLIQCAEFFNVSVDYLVGVTNTKHTPKELTENENYKEALRVFSLLTEDNQQSVLNHGHWLLHRQKYFDC